MTNRVTLSDVAREAGVHTSTASRALNESTRAVVNPQTVQRVLAVANELGYRPHPLARGLRTNRTMTVGFVIPDVENPLFGPIIAGAEAGLAQGDYSLLIVDDRGDPGQAVETLLARRTDGLIVASSARVDDVTNHLSDRRVPVVLVNRSTEGDPFPSIVGDDHAGIGAIVEHLAGLGHRRIGHVAGPRNLSTGLGRYQAFLSWTQSLGIDAGNDDIEEASWFQVEPGFVAASALLDRRPDLTAIVAANDLIALGCYRAIRQRGLEVGVDISVTGYNDMSLLDLMQPPMTSVRVPYRQMGEEAASTILSMIAGGPDEKDWPVSRKLVPRLVVRDSTRPPRL